MRAVPDPWRRPVVVPVVGPVVVQLQLTIVIVPVEVRYVRPVGIARFAIKCHQIQTHPNPVFYARCKLSPANRTECSIFCLYAYFIRKQNNSVSFKTRDKRCASLNAHTIAYPLPILAKNKNASAKAEE